MLPSANHEEVSYSISRLSHEIDRQKYESKDIFQSVIASPEDSFG